MISNIWIVIVLAILAPICLFLLFLLKQAKNQNKQILAEKKLIEQNQQNLTDQCHQIEQKHLTEKIKKEALEKQIETEKLQQEQIKQQIENQFKLIAQNILEQKSEIMKKSHIDQLNNVINPFKENVEKLEKRVNEIHHHETKQRATLEQKIIDLTQTSYGLQDEAKKLSNALNSNKIQGNWGETVLERLFEAAGLKKNVHYQMQKNIQTEQANNIRPDALIYLPDNKVVIIDAKVSIKYFVESLSTDDNIKAKQLIKLHCQSIRNHIKNLSQKDYASRSGINAFSYVLMFLPSETSLTEALNADESLYIDAVRQNILLVTPSTLLVSLTAIQNLWQSNNQFKNIEKIINQGSKIYDKARLFVQDIESIGQNLKKAEYSYDKAYNKLTSGRGNLIALSDKMKQMGVKVKKPIETKIENNNKIS